jgi:hypothetical protein
MDESEKKRLEIWCRKFFENNQIGFDSFDFNAEVDSALTIEENKTILRQKLGLFFNQYSQENIVNIKKIEAEIMPQRQIEVMTCEVKKSQEEQARLEFYNSLDKITNSKTTALLEQKFFLLREYVKMVCKGNCNGMICIGEAGTGKSFNILKTLKDSGDKFVYCSGFTTPLELYNFLYEHNGKVIYLDDTKNILRNEICLELLKSALFSPAEKRIIRYSTTSSKLKYPHQFIFDGKIILAINELTSKQNEDLKAVMDRVLFYHLKFNYEEKLMIIADLIKLPYKDLSESDRKSIFEYLKKNTSEATTNFSFRLLFKLYEIYRYDKFKFESLARHLISTNKNQEIIVCLLKKNLSVKQAQEEFSEITGLSRRSFYDIKARIK